MPKRHKSMSEFAHSTLSLTEFLEEDPDLDIVEQIFIENHIYVVRSAYGAWKRRHPSERSLTGDSSKKRIS
ncbi:MAG: protein of unknown function [Nitrospira sp.]